MTIVIDILSLIWQLSIPIVIVLKIIIMLSKLYAVQDFLRNGKGTRKAREILARKLRIFVCICFVPSNIIKEVRMRIVALGLIHLVTTAIYGMLCPVSFPTITITISVTVAIIIITTISIQLLI